MIAILQANQSLAHFPAMPDPDLSKYLAYLLASANRRMRLGLAQSIAAEDVTEEHWRILQVLSDEQGRSMGELAELVLLNHPALTKNIDRLVSRGLVQRAADPQDSRKVLVYISDRGIETVARLKKSVDTHHDEVEEALGQRKAMQLKRLLGEFIEELQRR
jgi:DNA-binding MarR family transcriptional regulator